METFHGMWLRKVIWQNSSNTIPGMFLYDAKHRNHEHIDQYLILGLRQLLHGL